MAQALAVADKVYVLNPNEFCLTEVAKNWICPYEACSNATSIVDAVLEQVQVGDAILVMSNRGFDNIHQQLVDRIDQKFLKSTITG